MRKPRNLLFLNNTGNGFLYQFPSNFELPPKIVAGRDNITFVKTNRVRTVNDEVLPIYLEANARINLEEYADVEEASQPTQDMSDNVKKPRLIYMTNENECELYDISLEEYNNYRSMIDAEIDLGNDSRAKEMEKELRDHIIDIGTSDYEHGYARNYLGYLAKAYNIDIDSN